MISYTDCTYDTTITTEDGIVQSYIYSFTGLSSDTKPTRKYKNTMIQNGSSFVEMDTGKVFMYNEAAHAWVEFGG